jgi:hypothetical protein
MEELEELARVPGKDPIVLDVHERTSCFISSFLSPVHGT